MSGKSMPTPALTISNNTRFRASGPEARDSKLSLPRRW